MYELTVEEMELVDYMIDNCLEEDETAEDLLNKMKVYYSAYMTLAYRKPDDVVEYINEKMEER